jgi:hypothetical protein
MAAHRVESCFQAQQLWIQLRVATFRTVRAPFSAYGSPFLFSSKKPVSFPSFVDIVVTGLTNDQGFASSFEHEMRPTRPLWPHLLKIGEMSDLMDNAVLFSDLTQITFAR